MFFTLSPASLDPFSVCVSKSLNVGSKPATKPEPSEIACPSTLQVPKPPEQLPAPLPSDLVPQPKPCPLPQPPIVEDPPIVVIGAGISGLTAAARLLEAGLTNITILEGRGRPGGRIQSTVVADVIAELGADVSYPSFDSLAFRLAAADGFIDPSPRMDPARSLFTHPDGHPIDSSVVLLAYQRYRKAEEEFEQFVQSTERQLHGDFAEIMGRRLRLEVRMFPAEHRYSAARIMMGLAASRRMMCSRDHRFIRKDYHGAVLDFPGALPIPLGLRGGLAGLLRRIGPENLKYNKAVTGIRWGITSVADPQVTVCCEDGEMFTAQYVIVTLPLGVLKEQHRILFCPPLPYDKTVAIDCLEVNHVNKIYLEYSNACWLWRDKPPVVRFPVEKEREGAWNVPDTSDPKHGLLAMLALAVHELHRAENINLILQVTGLSRLSEHPGSNYVLSGVVLGEHAVQMEMHNEAEVIEELTKVLRQTTGDECIPYPIKMVRSKWRTERFTCGASTSHDAPELRAVLSEPVPEPASSVTPALLFAGEATSNKPGSLQGAAMSGLREAQRLLDILERREERSACRIKIECSVQI